MYPANAILTNLHFTPCTPSITLYTWYSPLTLYNLLSTLQTFTLHSAFCNLHFALHTPYLTLSYTLHFNPVSLVFSRPYSLHFALHALHCSALLCATPRSLYTSHSTLCTVFSTYCILHWRLYNPHFTLHIPQLTLQTPYCTRHVAHSPSFSRRTPPPTLVN